jgi:heme/copper-type cytochrome/quinol oxidase subunit 3
MGWVIKQDQQMSNNWVNKGPKDWSLGFFFFSSFFFFSRMFSGFFFLKKKKRKKKMQQLFDYNSILSEFSLFPACPPSSLFLSLFGLPI